MIEAGETVVVEATVGKVVKDEARKTEELY